VSGERGEQSQTTPRNKDARAQGHDEGSKARGGGAAHGQCAFSSLRVLWWWMLTMNSHCVEISIARCVRGMVRDPNPMPRGCPYIGVLPSTLTLRDSYSRVTLLMTHSKS